jgi:hypothetical protein
MARGISIKTKTKSLNEISTLARKWAFAILVLFTLNAFSLNLGYGSPIFFRLCGFISLIVIVLLYSSSYARISDKRVMSIGAGLILASFIMIFSSLNPEYLLPSLVVFICGFDLVLRSSGQSEGHLAPVALGSLAYAVFYAFYIHVPALWLGVRSFAQATSGIVGRVAGSSLVLGPTVSGTLIFLTFVFCISAFFILSEKSATSKKVFVAALAALAVIYAGYALAFLSPWMTVSGAMDSPYIVFLILLIPFALSASRLKLSQVDIGALIPRPEHAVVLAAIFLSILLISIFPYSGQANAGKIVIYERDCEMGFDIPQFPKGNESFQPDNGFSVGALRLYLQDIGYNVEELNSTNPHTLNDALKDANILLMMNLKVPFSPANISLIQEFVKGGGNLLIFGEHTSMFASEEDFKSGRDYLDDILVPTGIKVNPDTADYIQNHWTYGAVALPHYVTKDLGFEVTTSSVGASLSISGAARPVIIGRYSFSDDYNSTTPGHLGDRTYQNGEALGDLVLAASTTYGKGKVLVFGDTSFLFNSEMPSRYKMIYDSVTWLMSSDLGYGSALAWSSFIVLAALVAFIIIRRPRITVSLIASSAVMLAIALVVSGSINGSFIQDPARDQKDLAWIDHAHLNEFNMVNYQADSITGVTTNLFRNGYIPIVADGNGEFQEALKGSALFIIAPNKDYTSSEASRVRDFVEGGGLLIISAGHKSAGPLHSVLESLGMQIGDLPLGSPPWIVETHGTNGQGTVTPENLKKYWHEPKFMEAYPVVATGNYTPVTWLSYGGSKYNLIASKSLGKGRVILIGDSRFLLNENLESLAQMPGMETKEQYQLQWLGNIELFREMMNRTKGGSA